MIAVGILEAADWYLNTRQTNTVAERCAEDRSVSVRQQPTRQLANPKGRGAFMSFRRV